MSIDAEATFDAKPWEDMIASIREKWDDIEARNTFGAIVAATVFRDVLDHFANQQGPEGKWKSWSESYQEHMAGVGKSGNLILQDTGRLRQSFTPANYYGTSEGLVFFNNAQTKGGFPYAKAHNEGGDKLPQRQFMWLSEQAMDKIVDVVEAWLNPESGDE